MNVVARPRNGLSLCAGGGGLDMGLMLAEPGFHTRCFVEWEEYPRSTIIAAQRAGYLAPAPIWDDLTTFDARPLAGAIDTLLAGYPCQPFSAAGKRLGEADPRHLWPHVARVATELGDSLRWIFLENVAGHITLGAETVLRTLWDMGFTPAAGAFSAAETGAPHERLRWFCVAYRDRGDGDGGGIRGPGRWPEPANGGECMAHAPRGGQRVLGDQAQPGSRGYADGGDGAMENSISARAGSERGTAGQRGWNALDGRSAGIRCGDGAADPDGGNPGAEREQPSREQRFQPEGGGTGGGNVDDASHGGRGIHAGPGPEGGGAPDVGGARRDMADAIGHAGHQRGHRHRNRTPGSDGKTDCPCAPRPSIFPPGPGDRDSWAVVLAANPDRAPSFARRDAVAAAVNLASVLPPDEAEAIEPRLRGLPRGALMAAVVREAPELVDETQALTRLRNLADGLAHRTRALRLLGNGVCPIQAAYAWRSLAASHGLRPVDLATADRDEASAATQSVWRVI